jgi:hypothetical protein
MKKTRLLEIIREEITSALSETLYSGPGSLKEPKVQQALSKMQGQEKADAIKGITTGTNPLNLEEEELLNEVPYIGGERGEELFAAIKTASNNLKDRFPTATPKDISQIILSKKKRPELAPEVEDALDAQFVKFGGEEKYTTNLGGPQTLRAVEKALGVKSEKSTEPKEPKVAAEPKAAEPKAAAKPKAAAEPKAAEPKTVAKPKTPTKSDSEDKAMKSAERIDKGIQGKYAAKLSDAEEKAFVSYKKQASSLANKIEDAESPEDRARLVGQLKALRNDPEVMALFKAKGVSI